MYRHPQINKFHFFEAFRFLLVKSNLERGGGGGSGTVLLILYDAQQCRVFFSSLSPSACEFDKTDMRFHLRKSVVTFEKKSRG